MEKKNIVETIESTIEREIETATQAAMEAAGSATDEESRQENKYDTRGLEASYVASAQASYAKELKDGLQAYHNLTLVPFKNDNPVALGALVTTLSSNGQERFFIGPAHGGLEIEDEDGTVTVLTTHSPIGEKLIGKRVGDHTAGEPRYTVIRVE